MSGSTNDEAPAVSPTEAPGQQSNKLASRSLARDWLADKLPSFAFPTSVADSSAQHASRILRRIAEFPDKSEFHLPVHWSGGMTIRTKTTCLNAVLPCPEVDNAVLEVLLESLNRGAA